MEITLPRTRRTRMSSLKEIGREAIARTHLMMNNIEEEVITSPQECANADMSLVVGSTMMIDMM